MSLVPDMYRRKAYEAPSRYPDRSIAAYPDLRKRWDDLQGECCKAEEKRAEIIREARARSNRLPK